MTMVLRVTWFPRAIALRSQVQFATYSRILRKRAGWARVARFGLSACSLLTDLLNRSCMHTKHLGDIALRSLFEDAGIEGARSFGCRWRRIEPARHWIQDEGLNSSLRAIGIALHVARARLLLDCCFRRGDHRYAQECHFQGTAVCAGRDAAQ